MMGTQAVREADPQPEAVFDALDDDACRAIVRALEEPMTAGEVSEASGVPLSTTYKKLDQLTDAGLLEERTELDPEGHHRSRYFVDFDRLIVALDETREFDVSVDRPSEKPDERLVELWSELRRET